MRSGLATRLPNPPALFVGRADAVARLHAILERGPIGVVVGPRGAGKTALVSAALQSRDATYLACPPHAGPDWVSSTLQQALDISKSTRFEVLDAADARAQLWVLDDMERLDAQAFEQLIEHIARYGRHSTWVLICTERPMVAAIAEQVLNLGPLDADAVRQLVAARADIDAETAAFIVSASGGWPGVVRGLMSRATTIESPLGDLPPAVVQHLAQTAHPIADASVSQQRVGLDELEWALNIGQGEALVRRHAARWLAEGQGARLWAAIADDVLIPLDLRRSLAVDIATDTSLSWLAQRQPPDRDTARRDWVQGMLLTGNARAALTGMPAEQATSVQSQWLRAEALQIAGEGAEALEVLADLKPRTPVECVRHHVLRAQALYQTGAVLPARQAVEAAEARMSALDPAIDPDAIDNLEAELASLRIELGDRTSSRVKPWIRGVQALVTQGARLATAGHARRAGQLFRRLHRRGHLPVGSAMRAHLMQGILRTTQGNYAEAPSLARQVLGECERLGNAGLFHWAFLFERLVNLSDTFAHPEPAWPASIPAPVGIPERYLAAARICHATRQGQAVDLSALPRPGPGDGPMVHIACELTRIQAQLLAGDWQTAVQLAEALRAQVQRTRYVFVLGEVVLLQCFAELRGAAYGALRKSLGALDDVARRLFSRRYTSMASLMRLALGAQLDWLPLQQLRTEADASPTVARVACVLLGQARPDPMDAFDRLLADGVSTAWHGRVETLDGSAPADWVFDAAQRWVQLDSERITISPLAARILTCVFEATRQPDGYATIETVAQQAWDIESFHPLRDSKRVHVAIRRLRTLLEETPSQPMRLVTMGEGYALGRTVMPGRVRPRVAISSG